MRKIVSLFALALLMCMMLPTTQAVSNVHQEIEVAHIEFGDFEIETTTIIYDSMARSGSKSADRISTVKQNGKVIAEVTLSATFGYDGKTAWVSSASGSHVTYDNWSYGNESITKSGRTASLSGRLTHSIYGSHTVNISMTCSPTGQIS